MRRISKEVVIGGTVAAGLLGAMLIGGSATAEAPMTTSTQPAVELMDNAPVEGGITLHDFFPGNGTRVIFSPDDVKIEGTHYNYPPTMEYCLGHTLVESALLGPGNSGNSRSALAAVGNADVCADGKLTPSDFNE